MKRKTTKRTAVKPAGKTTKPATPAKRNPPPPAPKPVLDPQIKAHAGLLVDRKQLEDTCKELAHFVIVVGNLLKEVESDNSLTKNFEPVAEKLVKIKGSARQMGLKRIAELAELAEELAIKGAGATRRPIVRRVVGALWDATTTITHMIDQVDRDTSDEADILVKRLDMALKSLGGGREKLSQDQIDDLFTKG